ncbi:MAG: carboxy terminal-processing peptidase [Salibacteraceae bacterium]
MKFKGLQLLVSTGAALLLCSYILYETGGNPRPSSDVDQAKDRVLMEVLIKSLQNSHFEPKVLNDEFSENVYSLYLKRLDFNKRFLLQKDVEVLERYKTDLDDLIKAGDYTFFDKSYELFMERVKLAKGIYPEILNQPFDFEEEEHIDLDEEHRSFSKNEKELKEFWRKSLKYQTLTRIHEMERKQNKASEENDTLTVLSFDEMEAKARKNLIKNNDRFFERVEKWKRDDLKEVYINAIMNVFGPHTGYFPPKDKENFDISMSGQLEGIGAQLREQDGYIKVVMIVPGSPSYLQGELEEGDIIMKVAQEGESPIDITDTRIDDAVKLIRGKKGTTVHLTIKKINGLIKEISIVRDIVILEETYAKSAIIEENDQRVGYIKLPKFYADFNKNGGRSAAIDVRTELEKLKAENVSGVVLDLRGNGGGSLKDAIDMTGHFIDQGPVVQVKGRYSKAEVMSDRNKQVTYEGPLIVLLNQFSASASEILAAAIQDYGRGIIMGSNSSFGKGTVQRFFELDRYLNSNFNQYKPLGAIKITTQKFYRINGDATQLKGVMPDIELPSQYTYLEMGEKEQEFVMPWDDIEPVSYNKWIAPYDKQKVTQNSRNRIKNNELMSRIDEKARELKAQSDETTIPLNYQAFSERQLLLDQSEDEFDRFMKENKVSLNISNLSVDRSAFEGDSVKTDINEKWLRKLRKDETLLEAAYVIGDMNNIKG